MVIPGLRAGPSSDIAPRSGAAIGRRRVLWLHEERPLPAVGVAAAAGQAVRVVRVVLLLLLKLVRGHGTDCAYKRNGRCKEAKKGKKVLYNK